jgi:L-lactate dehydrogenase complex protein LldE
VDFPGEQTCCGQMHFNTGYAQETVPLVRRFVRAFADAEVVVSPSASCVAMVRDQYPRVAALAGDRALADEVAAVAPRVLELSELLVDRLGVEDVGAYFPHRVTYHPTCHGLRMLGLGDKPLRLLHAVRGIEFVDLPQAKECCGFGGTFAVKSAEVCVAGDSSCLMHVGGALSRQRSGVRTMHLAEVLAATDAEGAGGC